MAGVAFDTILGLIQKQKSQLRKFGREPRYVVMGREPYEGLIADGTVIADDRGLCPVRILGLEIVMVERLPEMIQVVSAPDQQFVEARDEEK